MSGCKKILLVLATSLEKSPYARGYISFLRKNSCLFDLIVWNRDKNLGDEPTFCIPYERQLCNSNPPWRKVLAMWHFSRFVKKIARAEKYDGIIVFTIATAVFLQPFLSRYFNRRFIFDIRDHSKICRFPILKSRFRKLVRDSAKTVISSEGFKQWLPQNSDYVIGHNTTKEEILAGLEKGKKVLSAFPVRFLTIGQLRDYTVNSRIISGLANNHKFYLTFSGIGPATLALEDHAKSINATNIAFTGRYQKDKEREIVQAQDMINCCVGDDINSRTLMTNRFYHSVILRKPMLVNDNTLQAMVVKRYNLGLDVSDYDNLGEKIINYWETFDGDAYEDGCQKFLKSTLNEIEAFEDELSHFLQL